jgi:hypothetical protein
MRPVCRISASRDMHIHDMVQTMAAGRMGVLTGPACFRRVVIRAASPCPLAIFAGFQSPIFPSARLPASMPSCVHNQWSATLVQAADLFP